MGPRSCRPVTVVLMCPRHHFPLPSSVCHSAYDNKQKRVLSRVFNCINQTRHGTHRGHGGPREHALSSKLLDLPPHLALPLPPLDRLSLVPQVLPTREAYLQLEPVLLVEVCTQPGCPTPQSQQPGPWLHRKALHSAATAYWQEGWGDGAGTDPVPVSQRRFACCECGGLTYLHSRREDQPQTARVASGGTALPRGF